MHAIVLWERCKNLDPITMFILAQNTINHLLNTFSMKHTFILFFAIFWFGPITATTFAATTYAAKSFEVLSRDKTALFVVTCDQDKNLFARLFAREVAPSLIKRRAATVTSDNSVSRDFNFTSSVLSDGHTVILFDPEHVRQVKKAPISLLRLISNGDEFVLQIGGKEGMTERFSYQKATNPLNTVANACGLDLM